MQHFVTATTVSCVKIWNQIKSNLIDTSDHKKSFKYTVTLKPGLGSLYVIENYTIQCGTHDFLLTFLSNYRPISHRFRDKRRYPSKIANFPTPCIKRPRWKGSPWNLVSAQVATKASMMALPDGWKSFKIGLVVLIQYRLWWTERQTDGRTRCCSKDAAYYVARVMKSNPYLPVVYSQDCERWIWNMSFIMALKLFAILLMRASRFAELNFDL